MRRPTATAGLSFDELANDMVKLGAAKYYLQGAIEAISIALFDSPRLVAAEQSTRITKTGNGPVSGLCLGGAEGT